MKKYRAWAPSQQILLPQSPDQWLPEGHLAYFVLDVVSALDISALERSIQAKDARGERPYSPRMMLALLLYGYCIGMCSSRRIAQATYDSVAFRVIAAGHHPHFTRISTFRKQNIGNLPDIFLQVLKMCRDVGLVKLGHVAIDGTKMQANASRRKAMSYDGLCRAEKSMKDEVHSFFDKAQQVDLAEDKACGIGVDSDDLSVRFKTRSERLKRIQHAKARLEIEAKKSRAEMLLDQAEVHLKAIKNAKSPNSKATHTRLACARLVQSRTSLNDIRADAEMDPPTGGDRTKDGLKTMRVRARPNGKPRGQAQYNFTDPDSRLQMSNGAFVQGYNCQVAVDGENHIIVSQAVTNRCIDSENLAPMMSQVVANCGDEPDVVSADAGYWNAEIDEQTAGFRSEVYVPLGRYHDRKRLTPPSPAVVAMRRKMASAEGAAIYARRKAIVEPVNENIKERQRYR